MYQNFLTIFSCRAKNLTFKDLCKENKKVTHLHKGGGGREQAINVDLERTQMVDVAKICQ